MISCTQNNNRKVKKIPKTQTVKRTSFRLNEKLNKLLITNYAKVENKEQKRWQTPASHDSSTFQAFKLTRIQVFHDNNKDFKSRYSFVRGERGPVALFKSFVEQRPLLKHPCDGLFLFFLGSKRNRKFKDLVQTKPMCENTIRLTVIAYGIGAGEQIHNNSLSRGRVPCRGWCRGRR